MGENSFATPLPIFQVLKGFVAAGVSLSGC
jgi:hypothetical protein